MTSPAESLVVATFNIRRCIGTDGRHDPARTARVILGLDADVIAIQEIDSAVHLHGRIDQLRYLARATGLRAVGGPTVERHYGSYGNAILTRLSILEVSRHDLTIGRREPRAALIVDLLSKHGPLRMVTTHLGLRQRERLVQIRQLLAILRQMPAGPLEVLAGDFNEPWRNSPVSRCLRQRFDPLPSPRTFPARRPLLPLDRIWVRPASLRERVEAVRIPCSRTASDHLPLVAWIPVPLAAP